MLSTNCVDINLTPEKLPEFCSCGLFTLRERFIKIIYVFINI